MTGLQFELPWVLAFLLALPPFAWLQWRARRREALPYAPLQYRRPQGLARARQWLAKALVPSEVLLLASCIVALAGPYRSDEVDLFEEEGIDVVLALDISLSMLATDFPPNRLEALRGLTRDFIHRSGGNRLGVLVFAKDTFVHTPLTTDHETLLELLEGVAVHAIDQAKSGGTAIGDALLVTADHLERSKVEGRDQAVILITDGESNLGVEPSLAGRYLKEIGARFYAIGIGGTEPMEVFFEGRRVGSDGSYLAVLDEVQLRNLAEAAGGSYFRATEVGVLEEILAQLSRLERAPLEVRRREFRRPYNHWLVLAGFLFFAAHLTLAGLVARRPIR